VIQLQKEQLRHNRPGFVHISGALHCGAYAVERAAHLSHLARDALYCAGADAEILGNRLADQQFALDSLLQSARGVYPLLWPA